MKIVVGSNISFSYRSGQNVLHKTSFCIERGDFAYLVGPNGCGKTTLVHLILGLLRVQSGSLVVFGKDPRESVSSVAYVPQHINYDPLFPISVSEVVVQGRRGRGVLGYLSQVDYRKTEQAIDFVGMGDYKNERFGDLSGGLKQRTLIARAICHDWSLLILDEPYVNVDSETRKLINTLLSGRRSDQTVLFISHDTDFASTQTTRILCINNSIVEHSTSGTVHENLGEVKKIVHE